MLAINTLSPTSLIVVSTYGTSYDYIDVASAPDLGILVTHTPQAVVAATAELGLTLIMALMRHIVPHDCRCGAIKNASYYRRIHGAFRSDVLSGLFFLSNSRRALCGNEKCQKGAECVCASGELLECLSLPIRDHVR